MLLAHQKELGSKSKAIPIALYLCCFSLLTAIKCTHLWVHTRTGSPQVTSQQPHLPSSLHPHEVTGLRRLQPSSNQLPKGPLHGSDHRSRFSALHSQTTQHPCHPSSAPARLPLCQQPPAKGSLSSRARRLANEFLARHEESSGMLIVCWRISKRFGEIYTDFHVTAMKVAQNPSISLRGGRGRRLPLRLQPSQVMGA